MSGEVMEYSKNKRLMSDQNKDTHRILMLPVRCIYVDYHQSMEHDRKYILGHEYEKYSICFSFIEENGKNQCEYIS